MLGGVDRQRLLQSRRIAMKTPDWNSYTKSARRNAERLGLVPWDRCPACASTDGFHSDKCKMKSACLRCGGDLNWPHESDLAEDGICNKCTDTYVDESECGR